MDTPGEMEDNVSVASGDSTAVYTPTEMTEQDIASRDNTSSAYDSCGSAPTPGRTYIIYHKDSGSMLSLEDEHLMLRFSPRSGKHWNCVQNLGWFGFTEKDSRNFLGRDGNFGFRAKANAHLPWEWFIVTRHENKGYHLQSPHWLSLRWVGIGKNGHTLIDVKSVDHAALWEFVEV
ncbi:hypothetical protein E0Z10_g6339 [Xylaria hypoxylon]|uniref:Uncharacterized protein n=1 Tax=Xylaria hypoxylon TaxID=37992 RepID=A0A4Z0Z185_9PEZI|nr:hypothetical protein E0Z10_g6339 [Xylaria hypoxylon]